MSQLTTFMKPTPDNKVMNFLVHVNRLINLKGIPLLKWIPIINKLPVIRGFCDITRIELSKAHENKLRSYIHSDSVAFIGPNHPEFFTDWMLDKEISARVAPKMASWATHEVVNGMGKTMQKFWLKNNLIAQIPGSGNKEAKDYSIEHALNGHAVLLHPEGHVGWHSDVIAPLFSGIFEMAYQAYIQSKGEKPVYIVPVVWKLSFNKNVSKELHQEISFIEKTLHFQNSSELELTERLYGLFITQFQQIASKYNLVVNSLSISEIQNQIKQQLIKKIALSLNYQISSDFSSDLKNLNKLNKEVKDKEIKKQLTDLTNIIDFKFNYYSDKISQENIAELLKKFRIRFCTKGFLNNFHKFIPIPVSSRTAFIEVPDAICLNDIIKNKEISKEEILHELQNRMQKQLNSINENLIKNNKVISYKNPLN